MGRNRIRDSSILCVLVVLLPIATAYAHHGGALEWQDGVKGPITGVATEFLFRFPHVVVNVDVPDGDNVAHWAVTTRWTPTILRQHGWTRSSIKPGDKVTVTYRQHVSDPAVVQMQTIEVNGEPLPLAFE